MHTITPSREIEIEQIMQALRAAYFHLAASESLREELREIGRLKARRAIAEDIGLHDALTDFRQDGTPPLTSVLCEIEAGFFEIWQSQP